MINFKYVRWKNFLSTGNQFIEIQLDRNPTTLTRSFGFSWGLGGWLLTPFIGRIGTERFGELRKKVADEISTTFESKYSNMISLEETLYLENIRSYTKQETGKKYLIKPDS